MISEKEYIKIVSETNADTDRFIDMALKESEFRELLVKHLMENKAINIYYHSYFILSKIAKIDPHSLYSYWENFSELLDHENSYHRNYGMDLISSLTSVASDSEFESVIESFYKQLNHEKISTVKFCISYSIRIIKNKPKYLKPIFVKILSGLNKEYENVKHRNLLISEFLHLLMDTNFSIKEHPNLTDFLFNIYLEATSNKIKKEIKKIYKINDLSIKGVKK